LVSPQLDYCLRSCRAPANRIFLARRVILKADFARAWFDDNRYQDYLSMKMAEAMAEYVRKRIRAGLGFSQSSL
jgi:cobalamin-dependent methionine synthase I